MLTRIMLILSLLLWSMCIVVLYVTDFRHYIDDFVILNNFPRFQSLQQIYGANLIIATSDEWWPYYECCCVSEDDSLEASFSGLLITVSLLNRDVQMASLFEKPDDFNTSVIKYTFPSTKYASIPNRNIITIHIMRFNSDCFSLSFLIRFLFSYSRLYIGICPNKKLITSPSHPFVFPHTRSRQPLNCFESILEG